MILFHWNWSQSFEIWDRFEGTAAYDILLITVMLKRRQHV